MPSTIAFIGIGLMGLPMARNLLKAGFTLKAWNRTKEKAAPLAEGGAIVADTLAEAVKDADVILTMLENGPVVEDVLFTQNTIKHIKEDAIVIDMGSIPPAMAKDHAQRLKEAGIHHLDAPVSGGTGGAAAASLTIMVGGEEDIFTKMLPIFQAMGRATYIGPSGTGQLSKCANQVIVGNTIAAVAEALLLAAAGGANPAAVREALSGGFADSRILQEHGKRMLEGNFEPGGMNKTQLKDLRTALDAVENINLPVTQTVTELYKDLVADKSRESLDHSSLLLELEDQNPPYKLNNTQKIY